MFSVQLDFWSGIPGLEGQSVRRALDGCYGVDVLCPPRIQVQEASVPSVVVLGDGVEPSRGGT